MKILVAIANYGNRNRAYLEQLLHQYRSMRHDVHPVVFSDIPKDLGAAVEVAVGLPTQDPWSLPFAHKALFAERIDDYDLFIYSEDDTLIEQRHVDAFLEVTDVLPADKLAGFLRYERDQAARRYCSTAHAYYHWVPDSVHKVGPWSFACFTNQHSASYMLTRQQLRAAIRSGGYLVGPHTGRYDLACTASTDPYTQCGFTKVICISRIEDFMLCHLPASYVGKMGVPHAELLRQVAALSRCEVNGRSRSQLFPTVTRLNTPRWDKWYYEPLRREVLERIAPNARQVLSVGCDAGATEGALVARGVRVVGIPLDCIIAESARSRGVEPTAPSFDVAFEQLAGRKFDGILLVNVLQYVPDPSGLLARCAALAADTAPLVIVVPNFDHLRCRRDPALAADMWRTPDAYQRLGIHRTTVDVVRRWIRQRGLRVTHVEYHRGSRYGWLVRAFGAFAGTYLSRSAMIVAQKKVTRVSSATR